MAGIAALAGGAMSLAGGLFGKDTARNVQLPPQFQMPGMGQAAGSALGDIGNLPGTQLGQQTIPQAQAAAAQLYNNPGAAALLQGAQGAQGLGQQAALGQYGLGGGLAGYGAGLLPYSQSLLAMGFDPQQALYNRTLGQVTDQTRAAEAARGIGNTPYGAGLEATALGNFNIDWQNQQLQRALQGAQGAGGLIGQGGAGIQAGTGLQSGAATGYGQFGAAPFAGYGQIGQGQFGALTGLQNIGQGAQGLAQTPIQDYLAYIGAGNQAGQVANQQTAQALEQARLGFNQNQILGGNVGAGLYGVGRGIQQGFPGAQSLWGNAFGGQPNPQTAWGGYNAFQPSGGFAGNP